MPDMFVHIIVFLDYKLNRAITISYFLVIRHLVLFDVIIVIYEMEVKILISTKTK